MRKKKTKKRALRNREKNQKEEELVELTQYNL